MLGRCWRGCGRRRRSRVRPPCVLRQDARVESSSRTTSRRSRTPRRLRAAVVTSVARGAGVAQRARRLGRSRRHARGRRRNPRPSVDAPAARRRDAGVARPGPRRLVDLTTTAAHAARRHARRAAGGEEDEAIDLEQSEVAASSLEEVARGEGLLRGRARRLTRARQGRRRASRRRRLARPIRPPHGGVGAAAARSPATLRERRAHERAALVQRTGTGDGRGRPDRAASPAGAGVQLTREVLGLSKSARERCGSARRAGEALVSHVGDGVRRRTRSRHRQRRRCTMTPPRRVRAGSSCDARAAPPTTARGARSRRRRGGGDGCRSRAPARASSSSRRTRAARRCASASASPSTTRPAASTFSET